MQNIHWVINDLVLSQIKINWHADSASSWLPELEGAPAGTGKYALSGRGYTKPPAQGGHFSGDF